MWGNTRLLLPALTACPQPQYEDLDDCGLSEGGAASLVYATKRLLDGKRSGPVGKLT